MSFIFNIIGSVISVYSMLCFVRIILTWVPQLSYSKPAFWLTKICDPYLDRFRGIRWLRMGNFDFSPAIALCLLGALSSVFSMLGGMQSFTVGKLLALVADTLLGIISSLLTFLIILFVIRIVMLFINGDSYRRSGFMLDQIDSSISPLVYRIARTFTFGTTVTYKAALGIAAAALFFVNIAILFARGYLPILLMRLPI